VSDCKLQLTVQLSAKQPILRYHYAQHRFSSCCCTRVSSDLSSPRRRHTGLGRRIHQSESEYADVLALQGTAKGEILAIARILRAKPRIAVDQTAASGEYCFNSGQGTMVHFATQPEGTAEDIVYEFDASGLIAAGLDPSRLQQLPERGRMTSGVWYFLPKGQQDPHHAHAMSAPTIAIAINVK
jgi:hypothetical protein